MNHKLRIWGLAENASLGPVLWLTRRVRAFTSRMLVVATVALVAMGCGQAQVPPPTPTPDVPSFAEGEATAVFLAYLRQRGACGWGRRYPPSWTSERAFYWSFETAEFSVRYEGHGEWRVSTEIPAYVTAPNRSFEYEERLIREAVPFASWAVYENTGTVLRLAAPAEC